MTVPKTTKGLSSDEKEQRNELLSKLAENRELERYAQKRGFIESISFLRIVILIYFSSCFMFV